MTTVKEATLDTLDIANDTRDRTEYGWLRRLLPQHATMLFVLNARLYGIWDHFSPSCNHMQMFATLFC